MKKANVYDAWKGICEAMLNGAQRAKEWKKERERKMREWNKK